MTTKFKSAVIIDFQSEDNIPEDVYEEIRQLWVNNSYGNDNYYHKMSWTLEDYRRTPTDERAVNFEYPKLMEWLDQEFAHLSMDDVKNWPEILIHWWW